MNTALLSESTHTLTELISVFFFSVINLTCQSDKPQSGNVDIINVKLNITSNGKTIFNL